MEICITVEYDEISLRGGVGDCKLSWVLFYHAATLPSSPFSAARQLFSPVVKSSVFGVLALSLTVCVSRLVV